MGIYEREHVSAVVNYFWEKDDNRHNGNSPKFRKN